MTDPAILLKAYEFMCTARAMAETFEKNKAVCRYVHSVSSGHEAIQLATAFNLLPCDFVSPYYRDESMLLGLGFRPYELMLQLLAKRDDPFSGGRTYYGHPSYNGSDKPTIIHQSSATGMQAIPSTGLAQGMQYLEKYLPGRLRSGPNGETPLVLCSMGDASVTEGEVSEAFQFASLWKLPIIFLVQDNNWGISVSASESRAMDAFDYAAGFAGLQRIRIDGSDFNISYMSLKQVFQEVRNKRIPYLVHARTPLLAHHTSGVRKEFYRTEEDLQKHRAEDPLPKLRKLLIKKGVNEAVLDATMGRASAVEVQFRKAMEAPEPDLNGDSSPVFAATCVLAESGQRSPAEGKKIMMVDAALYAIREIMETFPEAVVYGQDVGRRLGGVFRETATLAEQFGDHRVFNTAIQEAYIIGSTAGMSAMGLKPIVEVQFADYLFPGFNQLVTELSKSFYLTRGKFPVQALIRIPIGAYGGGGPYHSSSIESTLLSIKGIKIVYPSNAADMKGLMKAAFLDPNPVLMLEHKGLYWSKVKGTEDARSVEPASDYILPLGKAAVALKPDPERVAKGESCCIITYGMGVYWSKAAAESLPGQVEIIDLRTLYPLDEVLINATVKKHGKCLVLTEEQQNNSFAEALAGRISRQCFSKLDAPVAVLGAMDLPSVPLNIALENAMLPDPEKITKLLTELISY